MIKEAKGFGATIDEAKENAIKNLGASELDDIQFEVVAMPKKKVLGIFGGCDAEVRAYIEVPDKKETKRNAKKEKPAPKKAEAKKETKKDEPKKEAKKEVKKTEDAPAFGEPVHESEIDPDSVPGKAVAYIRTVLESINCQNVNLKVASRENASMIILDGDDLSILIGRRGETLDALQYLAGLVANNGGGHYKISIDICNYRAKREETLTELANRIAAKALETGKCRTLEPMNPYERKIIHTAVQAIEGVQSGSFGEGMDRRVVIAPEGVELRPRMSNGRGGHRNDRRGGRGHDRRPSSSTVVSTPTREPKRDSDVPLYGKIN